MKNPLSTFALAAFIIISSLTAALSDEQPVPAAVESPLLRGDWKTVHESLGKVAVNKLKPSARFAWGHACLACNDGNRALAVFLSSTADQARSWRAYAESLARNHAHNAVAQYLYGDALARCGDLVSARKSFDRALTLNSKMAMAWNARGVCCTLLGDMDNALDSFTKATEAEEGFADAHVSLGCYWVLSRVSDGARDEFFVAQRYQKDLALAWNGLGCAEFGSGNMDAAYADFAAASDLSPALAIAWANEGQVLASVAMTSKQSSTSDNVQTSLTFTSESIAKNDLTLDRAKQLAASGGIPAILHDLDVRESQLKAEARSLILRSQDTLKTVSMDNDISMGLAVGQEEIRWINTFKAGRVGGLPAATVYAFSEAVFDITGKAIELSVPDKGKLGFRLVFAGVDPHSVRLSPSGLFQQLLIEGVDKTRDASVNQLAQIDHRAAFLAAQVRDIEDQKRLLNAVISPSTSSAAKTVAPTINVDRLQPHNPLPPDNVRPKPPVASNPPLFPSDDRLPNVTHDDYLPGHPPSGAPVVLPWSYTKPLTLPRANGVITSVEGAHIDRGDWPVITFFTLAYKPPMAKAKEH